MEEKGQAIFEEKEKGSNMARQGGTPQALCCGPKVADSLAAYFHQGHGTLMALMRSARTWFYKLRREQMECWRAH